MALCAKHCNMGANMVLHLSLGWQAHNIQNVLLLVSLCGYVVT